MSRSELLEGSCMIGFFRSIIDLVSLYSCFFDHFRDVAQRTIQYPERTTLNMKKLKTLESLDLPQFQLKMVHHFSTINQNVVFGPNLYWIFVTEMGSQISSNRNFYKEQQ